MIMANSYLSIIFFFNDTATTEIYTLSLHDALPICHAPVVVEGGGTRKRHGLAVRRGRPARDGVRVRPLDAVVSEDRKSTRLNSSHANISYAVFCLKKKNF